MNQNPTPVAPKWTWLSRELAELRLGTKNESVYARLLWTALAILFMDLFLSNVLGGSGAGGGVIVAVIELLVSLWSVLMRVQLSHRAAQPGN
jgi:hypothetical protein